MLEYWTVREAPKTGEKLLGQVVLTPDRAMPSIIEIGDRSVDVRATFRRCHDGRLQFLGVGIAHGGRDHGVGFSPPLSFHVGMPRKANACDLDLEAFRAAQCPGDSRCKSYAGLQELHACSNQMALVLFERTQPPTPAEKARGVTEVIFRDQVGVSWFKADPVTGNWTEMTLERRIVRSEVNPRLHDVELTSTVGQRNEADASSSATKTTS
jgi:hypothetical protein